MLCTSGGSATLNDRRDVIAMTEERQHCKRPEHCCSSEGIALLRGPNNTFCKRGLGAHAYAPALCDRRGIPLAPTTWRVMADHDRQDDRGRALRIGAGKRA
jgi:hypothetical protein